MAYLSVLRQKEQGLAGFSRTSSFMPVTEKKETFLTIRFQVGENQLPVFLILQRISGLRL